MNAIVYTEYGPPEVLRLTEVAKPTPKEGEVLVKVHAASINAAESHIVRGEPFVARLMVGGILKPKHTIPGAALAGWVEAVGKNARQFQPGDEVYGDLSESGWGAFAEYACARESALALKPSNLTFEAAAAVPLASITALQGLRDNGKIKSGQKVLINGASGGVGTFAVQLAKFFGTEVTGVCSTGKLDLVRSLGADHVIDYKREDFRQSGQHYDLILDVGAQHSFLKYRRAMTPNGIYVWVGGLTPLVFQVMLLGPLVSRMGSQKFNSLTAKPQSKDLVFMKEILEAGKVVPIIDRCYPLQEVAKGLRHLEEGQARGKIIINVA